ncbi:hypothetical protein THAOC_26658, partial [Thalassiosira oceanica]
MPPSGTDGFRLSQPQSFPLVGARSWLEQDQNRREVHTIMSEQSEHPLPPDDAGRPRQAEDEAQAVASSSLAGYLRGSRKRDVAKDAAVAAAKGAIAVARELTTKREDGVLPGAVSDFIHELESSGGDAVERMVAVRTPVQAYVGELMQMVSFGKYREVIARSYYDQ